MELYQLRGFAAIAEAGTLTKAAEQVHITQPALSAQLKALEDELGVTLFDRMPTGMVLTAAGRQLLQHAERVLAEAQSLQQASSALKGGVAGKAVLGTLSDPEFLRLGPFMSTMLARYPQIAVELRQQVTGEAFEEVREGLLDASFYYGDLINPHVQRIALREVVYRVVGPAAWASSLDAANWQAIAELPWIIPPSISTHYQLAHELLRTHGADPARVVAADQEAVVSSLVVAGLGVALMREDLALTQADAGKVHLWSDVRAVTTLSFIYRSERGKDPLIRALIDALHETWPGSDRKPASRRAAVAPIDDATSPRLRM